MDNEKKNRILSKLRKLMDLKESARELGNEGEANAAAAGITRLLMEYNLNESDIPSEERTDNPIIMEKIPAECRGHRGNWFTLMVNEICRNNLCNMIRSTGYDASTFKKYNMLNIIGRKSNVDVVLYLVNYLSTQFQSIGRTKYKERQDQYHWLRESKSTYLTSFLLGCVSGLREKYNEMQQQVKQNSGSAVTALVLTTKEENDRYARETLGMRPKTVIMGASRHVTASAYNSGKQTGREANLSPAISGASSRNLIANH